MLIPLFIWFKKFQLIDTYWFTLTVGIAGMFGKSVVAWGLLDVGVVVSTIPIAILFSYLQRFLVRGLTAGAVNG